MSDDDLYCGPDLINAADRSSVGWSLSGRYAGLANGFGVLSESIRNRRQPKKDVQYEIATATGPGRGTSDSTSVIYAGNGENREWCFATTISRQPSIESQHCSSADESIRELHKSIGEADIVFVDGLDEELVEKLQTRFVRTPAWVKQRVRVNRNWTSQIQSLNRGTRQEISRVLRKYRYECRLTSAAADISHFYDELYQPYINSLFGKSAVIVDRGRFLRECARGVLIQLLHEKKVVASALLRPIGYSMAVVWTGMDPGANGVRIPGATDALDYFSLLYAHLKGCRWLDFGPSRADLFDGVLRYKRKWGSDINAGFIRQPPIYWSCTRLHAAGLSFLQRHAFLALVDGNLRSLMFIDGQSDIDTLRDNIQRVVTPGIQDYRIVALSPISHESRARLRAIHQGICIVDAESAHDAIAAAMRRD